MRDQAKPEMYYFCTDYPFRDDLVSIAGLAMTATTVKTLEDALTPLSKNKPVHWDNITKTSLNAAKGFLQQFCRIISESKAHIHLRFTSTRQVEVIHKMELGDNVKIAHLYYHLLLQRPFRFYGEKYALHLRPDNPAVEKVFEDMRVRIHKDAFELYGLKQDPIKSLKTSSLTKSPVSQMLSLAVGAITSLRHKKEADAHQEVLLTLLQDKCALPNLFGNSGSFEQRFSIWNDEPGLEHSGFRGLL